MITRLLTFAIFFFSAAIIAAGPLHVAVRSLDIEMFKQIMTGQPELNATDSVGMTPLHHACALGAVEMTAALLNRGADAKVCSSDGRNALHHAVSIAALCFNQQPTGSGLTICPLTIPQLLASAGIDVNAVDANGDTALHIAARNGLVGVIATLLQSGADPNCRNHNGETPLHLTGGMLPHLAAQVLLVSGANPTLARNDGLRPIDLAASTSNALLVNMLNRYAPATKP